jgi:hypothetical protein
MLKKSSNGFKGGSIDRVVKLADFNKWRER